jgi:hypothetical protein
MSGLRFLRRLGSLDVSDFFEAPFFQVESNRELMSATKSSFWVVLLLLSQGIAYGDHATSVNRPYGGNELKNLLGFQPSSEAVLPVGEWTRKKGTFRTGPGSTKEALWVYPKSTSTSDMNLFFTDAGLAKTLDEAESNCLRLLLLWNSLRSTPRVL